MYPLQSGGQVAKRTTQHNIGSLQKQCPGSCWIQENFTLANGFSPSTKLVITSSQLKIVFLLPLLHWSNSSFLLPVKYCGGWLFNAINALFGVAFWRCTLAELWKSSLDLIFALSPEVCGFYIGWTLAFLSPPLPLCRLDNEHPRKKLIFKMFLLHYMLKLNRCRQVAGVVFLILMRIPKSLMAR